MSEAEDGGRPVLTGDYRNLGELLRAAGQQFGHREALAIGDQRLSDAQWAKLLELPELATAEGKP